MLDCKVTVEMTNFNQEKHHRKGAHGELTNQMSWSGWSSLPIEEAPSFPSIYSYLNQQTSGRNKEALPSHSLDFQIKNILQVSQSPAEVM